MEAADPHRLGEIESQVKLYVCICERKKRRKKEEKNARDLKDDGTVVAAEVGVPSSTQLDLIVVISVRVTAKYRRHEKKIDRQKRWKQKQKLLIT